MLPQSGGCSASHPAAPLHHSQPHSSGRRADSGAGTRCKADKRRHTGMGSDKNYLQSFHSRARDTERLRSWEIGPSSSIKAESRPPAAAVLQKHFHHRHLSVNEARGSLQKGKWGGKQADPRPKGRAREEARMDALVPALKSHPGPSVLAFSLIFRVVHHLLQQLPVPKAVKQNEFHSWKWKNLSVSMVHSLLTGTWALTWWVPVQTSVRQHWDTIVYSQSTWRAVWVRVCPQHLWQSVAARRRRLCSGRVRDVGDSGI